MKRFTPWLVTALVLMVLPVAHASDDPADPYILWSGDATEPKPALTTAIGETLLVPRLRIEGHVHQTTGFPVDRDRTQFRGGSSADLTLRPSLMWTTLGATLPIIIKVDLEADVLIEKSIPSPIEGEGYPGTLNSTGFEPRRASLALSYNNLVGISGGFTTSQWGMGLLANSGSGGYLPGNGSIVLVQGGDVVVRTGLKLGPFTDAFNFTFSAAYDILWKDDLLLDGDEGFQVVAAATIEPSETSKIGVYAVRRHFESTQAARLANGDAKSTDVWAVDLTGYASTPLGGDWTLRFEAELAVIFGETELAPTTDFRTHDVLQMGAAAQLRINAPDWGFVFDVMYASGDRNFDDEVQNAFMADQNFRLGFIFYETVMAALSARAVATASNPELVGYPNEDLERLATRGSISNTIAVYPRAWWRPVQGFEMFVGTLLAFAGVEMADPFNSRLSGGQPKNAFDGAPGVYQGTEVNLGLRYSALIHGSILQFGLDAGVFVPGDALDDGSGEGVIDPVYGTRFSLSYRL